MALAAGQPGFIFGGNTGITYDDLQRLHAMLDAIEARRAGNTPQNIGEGIKALGEGILGGFQERRLRKDEAAASAYNAELWKRLGSSASDPAIGAGAGFASMNGRYTAANIGKPSRPVSADPADGDIYGSFIGTVKQGITNPYGLAAVAATGQRKSGYSAGNAYRQWSDPSESGQAGQAGGIMSWRA